MCGRYALNAHGEKLTRVFATRNTLPVVSRFNIAPGTPTVIVRVGERHYEPEQAIVLWGLVPAWAKEWDAATPLYNARIETAAEKPSFRAPFRRRRCLVPATGWYEWSKRWGPHAGPAYMSPGRAENEPFALAGLWERWEGGDGAEIETVTVLTTAASFGAERVHPRMPVIVAPDFAEEWLGPEPLHPEALAQSLVATHTAWLGQVGLRQWRVTAAVNDPRAPGAEGPHLLAPLEVAQRPLLL
jgi:putative SOS response-associated peptidase YedK